MCGIVGLLDTSNKERISEEVVRQMLGMIQHRGPDEFGIYLEDHVGLGSARLSIVDLSTGQQPISNEDGTLWIVFNGEIFNYIALRSNLEARGHVFSTQTDTEVILHLFEDLGSKCLEQLNGQFAFAIWDSRDRKLFLARDRFGIRPLFYTEQNGKFVFGSEIKAILAVPGIDGALNPLGLDQIFSYWSTLSPDTVFSNIFEIPPGHYMMSHQGNMRVERYYELNFPSVASVSANEIRKQVTPGSYLDRDYLEEFRNRLIEATIIRLNADVPVGSYLSGGIDSSTTSAIIKKYSDRHLDTFSIAFKDQDFDESIYQKQMAEYLGTDHHIVFVSSADIGRVFPDVIRHTETPILRTSPAPLFLLSRLVREHNYKVVLTGEGADEILAGYNIFKESQIRRFWARFPESALRPKLFERIYPYLRTLPRENNAYLKAFFGKGLEDNGSPYYSHQIRWNNTQRTKRFFSAWLREEIETKRTGSHMLPWYPSNFLTWDPLSQAQFLEITVFMSQYLLSAQGDRVAMAHSVEGRFPFLDHTLVEFCNNLPPEYKLMGLTEKVLLKKVAAELIPVEIWQRPKNPYRAPIQQSFFHEETPDYVVELLSPRRIDEAGYFESRAVSALVKKIVDGAMIGEIDSMALTGILSTQLVHDTFVANFKKQPTISKTEDLKILIRQGAPL